FAAGDPVEGKKIFFEKAGCMACHNIGRGDRPTGPDLKGVTKRRSKEWLKRWIKNPSAMISSDPIARELFGKFNRVPMPTLGLTDKQIEDVIAFIEQESKKVEEAKEGFKPLNKEEFERAKYIFFDRCSGCHGAKRWGATGPSLLPNAHVKKAKKIPGGGTRSIGTEALKAILTYGSPAGMPAWGKEGILSPEEIDLMARYVQMEPPEVPTLDLKKAREFWKLIVPVEKRPKKDPTNGAYLNYIGIILRDAGQVAIVDGTTKKMVSVVNTGKAVHILRSSKTGRYFYAIGRDGRLALIDLWYKKPKIVARTRTCWDARSVDSSKYKGFEDKYAIVGCYTPNQYAIVDGQTLEPLKIVSVGDARDWATGNKLPEVRVASIVASETEPLWVINLKEAGWVYLINYTNPYKPKEIRIKADNFLHDGGWAELPGSKEKRYFLVAANAKNKICVIDVKEHKLVTKPCIETGKIPHPGRGANFVHPKYGPVWATSHIGEGRVTMIGIDPEHHPQYAWKVVESFPLKSAGSLFIKTHPKSDHLWIDFPLSSKEGVNGQVAVYNIKTGKLKYITVSKKRVVHPEFNKNGDEVWISGWMGNKIFVYNDKTLKLKKVITGDWIKTPTGKFNVYNTMNDIY
ncbi:MAG: hypothetical protein D6780_00445, partial [Candidatus Dadabacteria bacterium]